MRVSFVAPSSHTLKRFLFLVLLIPSVGLAMICEQPVIGKPVGIPQWLNPRRPPPEHGVGWFDEETGLYFKWEYIGDYEAPNKKWYRHCYLARGTSQTELAGSPQQLRSEVEEVWSPEGGLLYLRRVGVFERPGQRPEAAFIEIYAEDGGHPSSS